MDIKLKQGETFNVKDASGITVLSVGSASTDTVQEKLVSGTNIKTINGESVLGGGNLAISSYEEITWSALKTKRDGGTLTPGMWYRITDYNTTTSQENTQAAGHQFDIIVIATDVNKLNENARAIKHNNIYDTTFNDGITKKCYFYQISSNSYNLVDAETLLGISDVANGEFAKNEENKTITTSVYASDNLEEQNLTYDYFQSSNLNAWEIKYSLDNDDKRFYWAKNLLSPETGRKVLKVNDVNNYIYVRYPELDGDDESGTGIAWAYDGAYRGDIISYVENGVEDIDTSDLFFTQTEYPNIGEEYNGYTVSEVGWGTGVIYYMKDEWNNECPYDFKNIQFKRYDVMGFTLNRGQYYGDLSARVEAWFNSVKNTLPYRFYRGYSDPVSGQDAVDEGYADLLDVDEEEILESGLKYCVLDDPEWWGDPGLIASFDDSINFDWFYTFTNRINNLNSDESLTKECYNNVIKSKNYLRENIFLSGSLSNNWHSNTLGSNCDYNTFGRNCYSNTFGNVCNYNTLGNECRSNTFLNECNYNTLGDSCNYNTFGNYYNSNTFGNGCYSNTFGDNCNLNTFGANFSSNALGSDCLRNIFGNGWHSNTFGNSCYSSTFGNECRSNTFGNGCRQIIFNKDYVQNVIVENGNQFITLTSTQTTSSSSLLRNITIAQGVNSSEPRKTISHNTLNDKFKTTYQNSNSTTVNV